jgi:hypothetical protein
MTDADLISLLDRTAAALDEEVAWLVDVDVDDRGRSRPSIPAADREFFDAVTEQAQALRGLVGMVRQRQAG